MIPRGLAPVDRTTVSLHIDGRSTDFERPSLRARPFRVRAGQNGAVAGEPSESSSERTKRRGEPSESSSERTRWPRRDDRVLRPFWLHQAAEYLIGMVIVAMGLQSVEPTVPTIAGGLVIVNAAVVDGPIGAFRLFSRPAHRIADVVVIATLVVLALLPFLDVDNASRLMMLVAAGILAVVWWNSSFTKRQQRTADSGQQVDRSEALGRSAGRAVGGIARAVRDRTK